MHVLVCDDDASTRYVIKRLLVQSAGCRITESVDGVECLRALEHGEIDLVILDFEMPNMNGLEVLEAIRKSTTHRGLPVILLTAERRAEVVSQLLQLGVLGYVLKPLRSERLMPLVETVRRSVRVKSRPVTENIDLIRLDPDHPAMLIDGDSAYREFFVSYAQRFGPVIPADSSLAGLALFKRSPVNLVFVGGGLGIIDSDLLFKKLRGMHQGQPLRIVSVHDAKASPDAGADDELPRSSLPDVHRSEMRRFLRLTGPLDRVSALAGDVNELLVGAATQVFGMMLDSPIIAANVPAYAAEVSAAAAIAVKKELSMTVDVQVARDDARRIAARLLLTESDALSDEDMLASMQELTNLLVARLHARLSERHVESECAATKAEAFPSRPVDTPEETHGMRMVFTVPAVQGTFAIVVRTTRMAAPEEAAA